MVTAVLFAALITVPQQPPRSVPTAADSVWVKELLAAAERELGVRASSGTPSTVGRLAREWMAWGDIERGSALLRSAVPDTSRPTYESTSPYQELIRLAVSQHMRGDLAAARRTAAEIPEQHHDALRAELAMLLLRAYRDAEADSVLALIVRPTSRASAFLQGTYPRDPTGLDRDQLVARLNDELARLKVVDWDAARNRIGLQGRLFGLGVEVPPLSELGISSDSREAVTHLEILADGLKIMGRPSDARNLLDSALVIAEASSTTPRLGKMIQTALLLEKRGAPGDSVRAGALRDSVAMLRPATQPMPSYGPSRSPALAAHIEALRRAKAANDLGTYAVELQSMDAAGYAVEALQQASSTAWYLALVRSIPELRRLLPIVWTLGSTLDAEVRDSERVLVVRAWLSLGADEALANAMEMGTRRYREQAIAGLAGGLSTERLVELAEGFEDPEARNLAFGELTKRYLAEDRLADANAAAEMTASGDARATALSGVALALLAVGDTTAARSLIDQAILELRDEGGCEGHCEIVIAAGQPAPALQSPATLVERIVAAAYITGERDGLETWARSGSDADARARAYVIIAETVRMLDDRISLLRMIGRWPIG